MKHLLCISALLAASLAATAQPPARIETEGSVWDGIYTSPDKSFQIRVPGLLQPGAVIVDEFLPGVESTVTFADDLCRYYQVRRIPMDATPASQEDLKQLYRERLDPAWREVFAARPGRQRSVDIDRPFAIETRFKARSVPCDVYASGPTGTISKQSVRGQILSYAFVDTGAVYEISYATGKIDPNMYFFFREAARDPNELLDKFLAGLSIPAGSDGTLGSLSPASAYYAAIDVERSTAAAYAMTDPNADEARQATAMVRAKSGEFTPPALLALGSKLYREGNLAEAAFWFYAALLRAQLDQQLTINESARAAVGDLFDDSEIERAMLTDLDGLLDVLKRVVQWDAATPANYDRRWPELLGDPAIAARLGEVAEDGAPIPVPERAKPAPAGIAEQHRADFLGRYTAGVAKERERRAMPAAQWERITEFRDAVFYVDFSTLQVDGALRSVWEVSDLGKVRASGSRSFLNHWQVDCDSRRYRMLYFSSKSGQMGEGQHIAWFPWPNDDWNSDFDDDAPIEKVRRAVCARPAPVASQ